MQYLSRHVSMTGLVAAGQDSRGIVERIMGMEAQLGADQYGHVDMAAQNTVSQMQNSSTTTTTTTTTTLTTQQRQEAGQLCLQSLNGSNMDRQQAQQTWNQIVNGQSDQLAEHFLRVQQSGGNQQQVVQQHLEDILLVLLHQEKCLNT